MTKPPASYKHPVSIAPMMDYTDRHDRYFLRLISARVLLYTEMVTAPAIVHGNAERLLQYNQEEHPIAVQFGGSQPQELAVCAKLADKAGYDEINLNVGCPSDRVQSGKFGACLMAEPKLVAECVTAMQAETSKPVTVKNRIGIDEQDSYEFLREFIEAQAEAGCGTFAIHARKAWLKGLSPRENREIPELVYERVYLLKQDYPELNIIINGGIKTLADMQMHLQYVDGVMIGREAYHNPWILAEADQLFYAGEAQPKTRQDIVKAYMQYMQRQMDQGIPLSRMSRHMLGLFHGQPGARSWRRTLSEKGPSSPFDLTVVEQALVCVD